MTDLEFIIRNICKRRGVGLASIDSVAFNVLVSFGLAVNTFLLPVVASTFYVIDIDVIRGAGLTGNPQFELRTNSGQGSAGAVLFEFLASATAAMPQRVSAECDSFLYTIGNHSAGGVVLTGRVYKVTTV